MRLIKMFFISAVLIFTLEAREKVNISFSNLSIKDFIQLVSKITNKNILVTYPINGSVDLISSAPVYDDELLGILVSVLESKGYTLVDNGSYYSVIRSNDAAKHSYNFLPSDKRVYGNLMITHAIKVKNENVDIVAAKIRYLLSRTAKLMTMRENNTIVITDYPKNIKLIKKVIKTLNDNLDYIVKIYDIKNTEAKKVYNHLISITKTLFDPKVSTKRVQISFDENTNAIIAVGREENLKTISRLVKKLDKESSVNNSVQIFELKNSDAKSVVKSLNDIISKQKFKDPSLKPNVSESEEINAVIAVGDPIVLKGIKKIIDELDKEKYQVYVQAKIIEINKKNADSFGIKYGFDGAILGSNGGLYALSANFGGNNFGIKPVLDTINKKGLNGGFALNMAIDFLQTKGVAKSISNPSILCVNNQESSIYVGKTISIVSGAVANNQGGVGTGITKTYKREDVGLTLKIKPRVSSIDKVNLNVEATLENIIDDGKNNATGQPVTSKQTVKTQAILRHGESIIIGGLIRSYERNFKTKVPLLGDIPWIGDWLFSSNQKSVERDNLIVILTPYVIDKSSKLSQLQKELGEMIRFQKSYEKEIFKKIEQQKSLKIDLNSTKAL